MTVVSVLESLHGPEYDTLVERARQNGQPAGKVSEHGKQSGAVTGDRGAFQIPGFSDVPCRAEAKLVRQSGRQRGVRLETTGFRPYASCSENKCTRRADRPHGQTIVTSRRRPAPVLPKPVGPELPTKAVR